MKILHVHKFFGFEGGAEVYLHRLMEHQDRAGHEVHVFSTRSAANAPSADAFRFVERLALDRREGWFQDARKALKFLWNPEAFLAVRRMLAEVKPDIVHLHNIYHHLSSSPLIAIREKNIPCVMTLHDYKLANPNYAMFCHGGLCTHGKDGHYARLVAQRCLPGGFFLNALAALEMALTKKGRVYERAVQFFLCPSAYMKRTMEAWGEPAEQLRLVPNPAAFPLVPAPRGGGYALYAGRLSPEKGLMNLLEASVHVPELPIKIAGMGPEEERLKFFVKKSGAFHIQFLGFVAQEKLAAIRAKAEAAVLPTLGPENASTFLLESMADGLPCLATDVGGNPELVKDGANGLLVRAGESEAWTAALRRFAASSNDERERMSHESRASIRARHLWSDHLRALDRVYADAESQRRTDAIQVRGNLL